MELIFILVSPQTMQAVNPEQWITPFLPIYGQQVVMSCPLEGNPSALYQWYHEKSLLHYGDGVLIQPNSNLNITLLNNNRTLFFENIAEEHNGRYICNAKNLLGNKNYTLPPPIQVDSK